MVIFLLMGKNYIRLVTPEMMKIFYYCALIIRDAGVKMLLP